MALSAKTLRDLQYLADGRSPVGDGTQALALAVLELLDRTVITGTDTGLRTPPDALAPAPDVPGAAQTDPR
jgi:hypothetical protein